MPSIKTYPNQKKIVIHKEKCDNTHIYAPFNRQATEESMRRMNGRNASGFLLWCYLSLNANGYEMALSNQAVKEATGMTKDAYDTAVKLLVKEGYLVQREGNIYDFYQVSQSKEG